MISHRSLYHVRVGHKLILANEQPLRSVGETVVTKVGRQYLTVSDGARYRLDSGVRGTGGVDCVFTANGLAEEREYRELLRECSSRSNQLHGLSTPQLRQLLLWLKEGGSW